jgi:hypothetical protein
VDPKLKCKKCSGKKVNRERKILEVSFMDPIRKRKIAENGEKTKMSSLNMYRTKHESAAGGGGGGGHINYKMATHAPDHRRT